MQHARRFGTAMAAHTALETRNLFVVVGAHANGNALTTTPPHIHFCFISASTHSADADDQHWLSQTEAGRAYKKLIALNPFFNAFFFNAGIVGRCLLMMA